MIPLRAKIATVAVLFFLGTFAGQLHHLLDSVRGKVETGTKTITELRETVTTIGRAVDQTADDLRTRLAALQAEVKGGHVSADQAQQIDSLLTRLKEVSARQGSPGPPGPAGLAGPPGPPAAVPATTTTTGGPGGTTATTRPVPTTSSTRPSPSSTTTTTRCAVGIGRLIRIGC